MITYNTGSLFETTKVAFGHGVNIKGLMGSGIAVPIKQMYPENFDIYYNACKSNTLKPGMVLPVKENGRIILNIASQDKPGRHARLDWLSSGVNKARIFCEERGLDGLAIPRIGAGIGGLEWGDVDNALHAIFDESPLELEIWARVEDLTKQELEIWTDAQK